MFEVEVQELMVIIFLGCGPRLEMKGKGDDDDDRDDDDDDPKHKDPCKAKPWNLPVINLQGSSNPKIKFCQKKDVDSCDLVRVQYSGYGGWKNITNFKKAFWDSKNKKDIFLQVNYVNHLTRVPKGNI